jgi:hypothetical protein
MRRRSLRLLESELAAKATDMTNTLAKRVRSSVESLRKSGGVAFNLSDLGIPRVKLVKFVLVVEPKQSGVAVRGSYGHDSHDIVIQAQVRPGFSEADLDELFFEVQEKIRHELEHSGQDLGDLRGTPPPPNPAKPKSVRNYYTNPAEVAAHVAGLRQYAKARDLSFVDVVDARMDKLKYYMLKAGMKPRVAAKLAAQVKAAWSAHPTPEA